MASSSEIGYALQEITRNLNDAKDKKKLYGEIVEKIDNELNDMPNIEYDREMLELDYSYMEASPESAEGKLGSVYAEKEDNNHRVLGKLVNDLCEYKGKIEAIRSDLYKKYTEYSNKVETLTASQKKYQTMYEQALESERLERERIAREQAAREQAARKQAIMEHIKENRVQPRNTKLKSRM